MMILKGSIFKEYWDSLKREGNKDKRSLKSSNKDKRAFLYASQYFKLKNKDITKISIDDAYGFFNALVDGMEPAIDEALYKEKYKRRTGPVKIHTALDYVHRISKYIDEETDLSSGVWRNKDFRKYINGRFRNEG